MRQIEVLYFASCPTWERTVERVRRVLSEAGLEGSVSLHLVPVQTEEDARRLRFLGSPTVRVDGEDVDPSARGAEHVGLQCRLYPGEGRLEGVPPAAWVRAALGLEPAAESGTTGGDPVLWTVRRTAGKAGRRHRCPNASAGSSPPNSRPKPSTWSTRAARA